MVKGAGLEPATTGLKNRGYGVLPGSVTNYGEYTIDESCDIAILNALPPFQIEIVEMLDKHFDLSEDKSLSTPNQLVELPEDIYKGGRNSYLTSCGGKLRRFGFGPHEIQGLLSVTNQTRCKPPLPAKDIITISRNTTS